MILPRAPGNRKLWVYDIEIFPNHFLAQFYNGDQWKVYDETQIVQLVDDIQSQTLVLAGYNNFSYDDMVLSLMCENPSLTTKDLYRFSKWVIEDKSESARLGQMEYKYNDKPWAYSIDVFQLLNGKVSLKEQQCRMGFHSVLESPCDFDKDLPDDQREAIKIYCRNDVTATATLLVKNWDKVLLRAELDKFYQLGNNIYRMSEQGIAEHTFCTLHRRRSGENKQAVREASKMNVDNLKTEWVLTDIVNPKVQYSTELKSILENLLTVKLVGDASRASWKFSDNFTTQFNYQGVDYQFGVGGLHSVDGPLIVQSTDDVAIIDMDVASYYPTIIISDGLYPKHLGPEFCDDMRAIRDRRIAAKRTGDIKTSEALKIVINATFGKLNDQWSPLRSVPDAMRVTVNGQLYLLMLIERVCAIGAKVISANTDGVTIQINRTLIPELKKTAGEWEKQLNLELEYVEYASIFRRDVNNYLAVKIDGKIKYKGAISQTSGKGDGTIIKKAAEAFILHGIPPDVTIQAEESPLAFLFYMRSKNDGTLYHGDTKLGKSARWYVSTEGQPLKRLNPPTTKRKGSWTTLPHADITTLAMDITTWTGKPENIDYAFYERAAWDLIDHMGPTTCTSATPAQTTTNPVQSTLF